MTAIKLSAVLVTGALSLAATLAPAAAASPMTNAFMANAMPNIDFLDRSSRFALDNSKSSSVREFAKAEAREQTHAANALDAWIDSDKTSVAANEEPLQTGRSVAIDGQAPPPAAAVQIVDDRMPRSQEDLDFIGGLSGSEFDDAYKTRQLDALTQLETDYSHYIAKGDDPRLLAIAGLELPKIRKRLAELKKL